MANLLEFAVDMLGPNAHIPTAEFVVRMWEEYTDPDDWDADSINTFCSSAPVYSATVRYEGCLFEFVQVGGGNAVDQFFVEDGMVPLPCPDCGGVEFIGHERSPWIVAVPSNRFGHRKDCTAIERVEELDKDQFIRGMAIMIVAKATSVLGGSGYGNADSES